MIKPDIKYVMINGAARAYAGENMIGWYAYNPLCFKGTGDERFMVSFTLNCTPHKRFFEEEKECRVYLQTSFDLWFQKLFQ